MAKSKPLPPLKELQKVLSYNPETGVFTWKAKPNRNIVIGSVAGRIDDATGYRRIRFKGQNWYAQRLAWLFGTGKDPGPFTVDHVNRDRVDNRIQNLRLATYQQQMGNREMLSANTSGFRGVSFSKTRNKWVAQISLNGKTRNLGGFATKEEAAVAYREAATVHFGEFWAS